MPPHSVHRHRRQCLDKGGGGTTTATPTSTPYPYYPYPEPGLIVGTDLAVFPRNRPVFLSINNSPITLANCKVQWLPGFLKLALDHLVSFLVSNQQAGRMKRRKPG